MSVSLASANLVLVVLICVVFLKTVKLDSFPGAVVALLYGVLIWLNITLRLWNQFMQDCIRGASLIPGIMIITGIIFVTAAALKKSINIRLTAVLYPLYVVFGISQQILFQYVVTRTAQYFFPGTATVILSACIFSLFHVRIFIVRYYLLTLLMGCVFALLFVYGSVGIATLGFLHALLATLYFVFFTKGFRLKNRISLFKRL